MRSNVTFRKGPVFKLLINVLSEYQCPSDCQSPCCKFTDICMGNDDFRILTKESKIEIKNVKQEINNDKIDYSIQPPCPFLSDVNKCSAYLRRPTVCRMYPFFFHAVEEAVCIYPCKLGMNILNDFFKFRKEKLGLDVPSKIINELKESNKVFDGSYDKDTNIHFTRITCHDLKLFDEYIHKNHK